MTTDSTWEDFAARMRELRHLDSMSSLMGWDEQTMMPPKAAPGRASVSGTLAAIEHERMVSTEYGAVIDKLEQESLGETRRTMVELAKRKRDQAVKMPARLVRDLAETSSRSQAAWIEARSKDDFSIFQPLLQRMFDLKAEQAEALGYEKEPYDAHLDLFERGATAEMLRPMFDSVTAGLTPVIEVARAHGDDDRVLPRGPYEVQAVLAYCNDLLERLGYDMEAGRLDVSAHPFTSEIGPGDVRVTTRVDTGNVQEAILGTLHEMGHALYHMGLRDDWAETTIGESVSLGVDESQSRLWENHVGRSLAFWEGELPKAKQSLRPWTDTTPEDVYRAVNRVRPSLVRVKADEVTYPLHVAVRFELELAISRGEIPVADLPAAWNESMKRHLGIEPPSDADGVLQDVHWSLGYLGYFPTYLIGSVYSAALFEAATQALGGADKVDAQLRAGEFAPLLGWLRTNVHEVGSLKLPAEVIAGATGKRAAQEIDTAPFVSYIRNKYGPLYGM